jgi:phosphoglycolate phosphatase
MSLAKRHCVVLFDLDGTLVESALGFPSAGLLAMNEAAFRLTGASNLGDPSEFAGRTDVQIARLLLDVGSFLFPRQNAVDELVGIYVKELERYILERPYAALGDPRAAICALERIGVIVGLGTGNVPRGATLKLASARLLDLFDLALGGYGDDGDTRAEVLAQGVRRCDPSGRLPVIIVGDTPRDVEAAHAIGAPCIGVPFKNNTEAILREAGADSVIPAVDGNIAHTVSQLIALR